LFVLKPLSEGNAKEAIFDLGLDVDVSAMVMSEVMGL